MRGRHFRECAHLLTNRSTQLHTKGQRLPPNNNNEGRTNTYADNDDDDHHNHDDDDQNRNDSNARNANDQRRPAAKATQRARTSVRLLMPFLILLRCSGPHGMPSLRSLTWSLSIVRFSCSTCGTKRLTRVNQSQS